MPSITGEHDYLDREAAFLVADQIISLFDGRGGDLPAFQPEAGMGSPHLVDSLDEAPQLPIEPSDRPVRVLAVDGGSSVLARGGNIEVIAWRAGYVAFEGHRRLSEHCTTPEITAYNRLNFMDYFRESMAGLRLDWVAPQPPLRLIDELRWLAEWRLVARLADEAEPGTLLLIDGSLRGNPGFEMKFQKDIMRRAADRQVHIAAVTKQSTLSLGGMPLDLNHADGNRDDGRWYRELNRPLDESSGWLGNIYLARLHPGANKPYRIDINRYETATVKEIFALLAGVGDDVEFCGYPYPLAAAHRMARIDGNFRQELTGSIGRALEGRNFPAHIWEYLSGDMHEKLNADVSLPEQGLNYG